VPATLVDEEVDRLRRAAAALAPADRAARRGDTLVIDLDGPERTANYVVELGDGRLLDEVETALVGASPGDERSVDLQVDGRTETLRVTVKEVREPALPAADDAFAREATEFESLAELRADIEAELRGQLEAELETRFRETALDMLAEASTFEKIDLLVQARMRGLWDGMLRSLARRGVRPDTYLAMTGQTPEQVEGRLRSEAERSVKRELALEAVADQLELAVADDEVEAYVREQAEAFGDDPDAAVEAMRAGGWETLRADLRFRKALDQVVAGVERIPVELARAREKLWTPEKEKAGSGVKIWTPGSEER
jgi:trigger factor